MSRARITILGILALTLLAVIWWQQTRFNPTPPLVDTNTGTSPRFIDPLKRRVETLENALFQQQQINRQLSERLSQLEQQLAVDKAPSQTEPPSTTKNDPAKPAIPVTKLQPPPTLQQKLLDAGLPLDTVERIYQRISETRLAQLELRNRAIREDWLDSPKYFEQRASLEDPASGLREQEGDAVYDQYLYAAGRPNRVMVTEVYQGSAADQAGIQTHDVILSYAQLRIFSMQELQQATTRGQEGEILLIEVLRDGERISTSVPRGPLGIAMTMTRQSAQPW